MFKYGHILFFLWLWLPSAVGNGILVEALKDGPVPGGPGEVVNLMFRVTNQSGAELELLPQWSVPDGWQPISSAQPFRLAAGQNSLQLFSVHIPANTTAGGYPILYSIADATAGSPLVSVEKVVEIATIREIELATGNAPEFVVAGEEIFAEFILQNRGNSEEAVSLLADDCVLRDGNHITLPPGGQTMVYVKAATMPTVRHSGRSILRLHAHLAGAPEVTAYASHFVQILPQAGLELVEGEELPASIRLSHLTRKFQNGEVVSGLQGEFHALGRIGETGQNEMEIRLRGPNRFNLSVLGQYDEYFARFQNEKTYAHLGDKVFSLTPLTEFSRFGRGAEARTRLGAFEGGGFYLQPRFFPEVKSESAAYFRYHYREGKQLGINLLQKNFGAEKGKANLISLHGTASPWPHTNVEAELSQGSFGDTWGNAFFLRANSRPTKRLNLAANVIHAGKFYPGYFNNSTSFYAQVGYQAGKRVHLSAHLNEDQRNPSQDTLFGLAPWSRFAQFSTGYKLGPTTSLRSILRHSETRDRMPGKQFDYKENILRLQLVKTWPKFKTTLTGEAGKRENLLNLAGEQISNTYRGFVDVNYRLSNRLAMTGFGQYFYYDQFVGTPQKQWIFGGNLNAHPAPFTQLRVGFQNNYLLEEYHRNRNLLNLFLGQKIGKRKTHELSASANYVLLQRTQQETDFSVQVNYEWRFGLRILGRGKQQKVYGQILDNGVNSVEGIVLLLNGQQATTAPDGSFSFQDVPPGKYFLMLDPSSTGLHDVPNVPMPLEVNVQEGVDAQLSFGLTKGASLSGKILAQPQSKPTRNTGGKDVPRFFMFEISDGEETLRRITEQNGYFEFRDLRPGTWKLRILNADNLKGFYFDRSEWELELLPGRERQLDIQLLRKRKSIKFQNKLSLTSAGQ